MDPVTLAAAKRYGVPGNGLKNAHVPALLTQAALNSKGGHIGTNGKGVVALRFDDGLDAFGSTIFPLLTARGLPASLALISRFLTAGQVWSQTTDWDDVRNWNLNGIEIWSHGTDHKDPTPDGYAGLVREIVESKADIEAQNIKVQGWAQPGATPVGEDVPYGGDATDFSHYSLDAGRLVVNTYGMSELYIAGGNRHLGAHTFHGLDHITADTMTLANAQMAVDGAAAYGYGLEIMAHPSKLGTESFMSVADFTTLLDYIETLWNAGTIEVLTPSGLVAARRDSAYRFNLITDPTFSKTYPTGDLNTDWSIHATHTVEASGGRTTGGYLSIPNSTASFTTRRFIQLNPLAFEGETWVAEAWWRRADAGVSAVGRFIVQNYPTTATWTINKTFVPEGDGWERQRFAFTIPPGTGNITFGLARNSGGGIHVDDVNIWKV